MPTFNEEYELNDLISNLLLNIEIKIKYENSKYSPEYHIYIDN